ncbi:lamin tail domain-containing protein [Agrococcus sp. ARC_14]|uniref:lamin tail domain-containing protein n=1 Tax=Agrococcus sp. ARC_14 TaxID=2919927 RepID=UPI001F06B927|nr:lamin tail domain-containing protein [Agrococcus sp. ARC_14]MCH1884256.1 lamin tail domain-containing protein [Agrococcus sp. ARC_14]
MRRRSTAMLAAAVPAALAVSLLTAPAAFAADSDIVINEVQSNSATDAPDFIELLNTGLDPVDLSGWVVKDDNDERDLRVADGTMLEPGAFLVIEPDAGADGFGLGSNDTARIFAADGTTLIDSYGWTDHAFTEGRLPDGTGAFVDTEPTPGAANVEREVVIVEPVDSTVAINEVQSDDATGGPDWVELTNSGDVAVDVSGWILRDDDDLSALPIAAGTVIEPGAFLVIESNATDAGFGLGSNDEIRLFTAAGTGLVDEYAWTDHAVTEGRVPDGTGEFGDTEPTRGAANVARSVDSPIVINEVESNGDPRGDWVELANTDQVNTIDLSGWTIVDADPEHEPIVLPEGTTIESGGYRAIITDAEGTYNTDFGLGGGDSVTLRDASGSVVDHFAWEAHAAVSYARCADMTGEFVDAATATFELVNDCAEVEEPVVDAVAWPYGDTVVDAVAVDTWGEDMSGLDFDADGTLWAINNDNSEIFELAEGDDGLFTIVESWVPHYADGSGQPDGEGISVGGDGAIYVATERDNTFGGVSRPSILRVELGADGASTTTHEWNVTDALGALGANLGIEAVEWISDADATRLGVVDASGTAYQPAAYGEHFGGVFAFAIEQTGELHLAVLEADGSITILQTTTPGPALEIVMGLDWQAGGNTLWALCDEACENRHSELAFVDGLLTVQRDVLAPSTMPVGYTNEGLALRWCDAGTEGTPTVAWIADTPHEGVSLRVAAGTCEAVVPPTEPGDGDGTDDGGTDDGGTDDGGTDDGGVGGGADDGGQAAGELPRTGADGPMTIALLAMLLALAGAGLLVARRRPLVE